MRAVALFAVMLAAACDQSPGVDEDRVNTQMIENVAFVGNEMGDPAASARLEPIGAPPAMLGAYCRFLRGDGALLLIALPGRAFARIGGVTRTLSPAGPMGAAGGFWRDRELAISIGTEPGAPPRARVTNRLTEAQEDHPGQWQCQQ